MNDKFMLINIGIGIYAVTVIFDRLIYQIPDIIYIPIAILCIILILIGYISFRRKDNE